MLVASNYSMVHGPPIQYYSYTYNFLEADYSPYFRKPGHYHPPMDLQEGLMSPSSPLSATQSDSDNSVSSLEVLSPPPQGNAFNNSEVQCKWRSCGILFPTLDQLAKHVSKVHSASGLGGLFYCGWEGCSRNDKGFNARYKMLVHVRTHTNEKPHVCTQCNKSFSRAENLKIHSRSHSGEKPYTCPVPGCNKAYSNSSDRFKHTRTHQVEKPYQCKVPGCSKRYTDPSSLRKHVKTYKHFVVANDSVTNQLEESMVEDRLSSIQISQICRENVIKHPCDCNRVCCISNCFTKNADLFKISALLNLKQDEPKWNQYIEPYILPYEIQNESIDLDAPLDLSLHRKHF